MKTLLLLLALVQLSVGQNDYQRGVKVQRLPSVDFSIRKLTPDSPSFREAYSLIRFSMDKTPLPPRGITIVQTAGPGEFLATFPDNSEYLFLLRTPKKKYADGSNISVYTEKTGELYKYTTVLGALKTIDVLKVVDGPATPTFPSPEQLFANIKDGINYPVDKTSAPAACKTCNGSGRVAVTKGSRFGDGKIECIACKGKGKTAAIQPIIVKW